MLHQYLGGGRHLQPLLGCGLILLPPYHPCVMEMEQLLGFGVHICVFLGGHAGASSITLCNVQVYASVVWLHVRDDCDQERSVYGWPGLLGHWHSYSCVWIDCLTGACTYISTAPPSYLNSKHECYLIENPAQQNTKDHEQHIMRGMVERVHTLSLSEGMHPRHIHWPGKRRLMIVGFADSRCWKVVNA